MAQNRKFKHGDDRYEIFWTSELAEHIAIRHQQEPDTHPLLHLDIARLLCGHRYFDAPLPNSRTRRFFILYDAEQDRIFRAIVTLTNDPQHGPIGRALVHSCVIYNSPIFRSLIYETF